MHNFKYLAMRHGQILGSVVVQRSALPDDTDNQAMIDFWRELREEAAVKFAQEHPEELPVSGYIHSLTFAS